MRTGLVVGSGAVVVALLGAAAFLLSTCASYRTEVRRPPDDRADLLTDDRLADKAPQPFDPARVHDVPCGEGGSWVQNRSEAVIRLDVPMVRPDTDRAQLVLHPSYADAVRSNATGRAVLPSINAIDGKAKQFDDGLVAALDLACFEGIEGKLVGRVEIVKQIHEGVRIRTRRSEPYLAAALELAGAPVQKPDQAAVQTWLDRFEANETLSKPIGVHTWNEKLSRVFRFTRFLQQEFAPGEFPDAPHVEEALGFPLEAYERTLAIDRAVHNPPACGSLLDLGDARRVAVLPRSSSRELELIGRLFPRGLPAGTNLMSELVRRIRSGEVDLAPRPDGGWLDRQVFALESLLLPERADERDKLLLTKAYKKRMLEAFQALLVKRLETHAMAVGEAAAPRTAPQSVEPTLRVEPCATYALRTARAYSFVESFLVATLGEEALRSMRGLREGGDRGTDLLTELRAMRDLFYGIHLVSASDVGMEPRIAPDEPVDREACRAAALAWLAKAYEDPDLAVDTRVSIPVWEDAGQTRLWATLGVRLTTLHVSWAKRPRIRPSDGSEDWREAPWGSISYAIPVDDFAEIALGADRSLSREELRKSCGTGRTREEILREFE